MFSMVQSKEKVNIGGAGYYSLQELERLKKAEAHRELLEIAERSPEHFCINTPIALLFQTTEEEKEGYQVLFHASPEGICYLSFENNVRIWRQMHRQHRHDFFELMYVIDGAIYQIIEGRRHYYPKGSCLLLHKNVYHTEETGGGSRIVFLQMKEEILAELLGRRRYFGEKLSSEICEFFRENAKEANKRYYHFAPKEGEEWSRSRIHVLFESMLREILSPCIRSSCIVEADILELLMLFFDEACYKRMQVSFSATTEQELFCKITEALRRSDGRRSRKQLAEELGYSGDYLYKIVRKFTGQSLYEYAMSFCMKRAAELLGQDMTVPEIMEELMFTNQTQFFKQFKKAFGDSPAGYRKRHVFSSF